ncbi:MAG TPA: hypothetical protein VII06_24480, partial [Chloroflexota bacterium]
MTHRGNHRNERAGPFERFLKQSRVYREFVEVTGAEPPESATAQAAGNLPELDSTGNVCVDLEVAGARFATSLDLSERGQPSVSLAFPSRVSRLEADDLQRCVRRVIDAAYPQRGLAPQVALLHNDTETRLDLAKYWDGAFYESALRESSPSAVIFYVEIQPPLPSAHLLAHGPTLPDLMYAFMPAYDDARELISLSYPQARHIGAGKSSDSSGPVWRGGGRQGA